VTATNTWFPHQLVLKKKEGIYVIPKKEKTYSEGKLGRILIKKGEGRVATDPFSKFAPSLRKVPAGSPFRKRFGGGKNREMGGG